MHTKRRRRNCEQIETSKCGTTRGKCKLRQKARKNGSDAKNKENISMRNRHHPLNVDAKCIEKQRAESRERAPETRAGLPADDALRVTELHRRQVQSGMQRAECKYKIYK